jgi:hypothetical protein
MDHSELLRKARQAFQAELGESPPLTLRGADAVDGYDSPEPYDAEVDAPNDEYLERFGFWAMPYLDARSWRHYLPRLIEYALAHPDDPAMVVEATRSGGVPMRPCVRRPSRRRAVRRCTATWGPAPIASPCRRRWKEATSTALLKSIGRCSSGVASFAATRSPTSS